MATPRLLVLTTRLLTDEARAVALGGSKDSCRRRRSELAALAQEPCVWLQAFLALGLWAMVGDPQVTVKVLHDQAGWLQALLAAGAWAAAGGAHTAPESQGCPYGGEGHPRCGDFGEACLDNLVLRQQARLLRIGGGGGACGGAAGASSALAPLPLVQAPIGGAGFGGISGRWSTVRLVERGDALLFAALLADASPQCCGFDSMLITPSPLKMPKTRGAGEQLLGLLDENAAAEAAAASASAAIAKEEELALPGLRSVTAPAAAHQLLDLLWGLLLEADLLAKGPPLWHASVEDAVPTALQRQRSGVIETRAAEVEPRARGQASSDSMSALASPAEQVVGCPIAGLFWLLLCAALVCHL